MLDIVKDDWLVSQPQNGGGIGYWSGMSTVAASIPVLCWAAQRARLDDADMATRFRKRPLWLSRCAHPTQKQLQDFARLTHTAFGYFFLSEPPRLTLLVPDFRALRVGGTADPSSDLLDTLCLCKQRQGWYQEHARMHGLPSLTFIGSAIVQDAPEAVAMHIRETLGMSTKVRLRSPCLTAALCQLIPREKDTGMMVSSVVGGNRHRKLDAKEFCSFALADNIAPLVFLNGAAPQPGGSVVHAGS